MNIQEILWKVTKQSAFRKVWIQDLQDHTDGNIMDTLHTQ